MIVCSECKKRLTPDRREGERREVVRRECDRTLFETDQRIKRLTSDVAGSLLREYAKERERTGGNE